MTAHELARQLLDGPDLPVHISYNYGDYWRTQVAPAVTEVVEGEVVHSAYHNMDKVQETDDNHDGRDEGDYRPVVLLS